MQFTFDLDGVLMENPFKKGVFPEAIKTIKSQYVKLYGDKENLDEMIWGEIMEEYKRRSKRQEKLYLSYDWDGIVQKAAQNLGCPGGLDISKLVKKYCSHPYIKYYDEPQIIFPYLKEKGFSLRIISNGFYKYQFPVLKSLGLAQYFEEIITPEEAGYIKPEEEIFKLVQKPGEEWYHVGDSLIDDIYGGGKAAAKTIWVKRDLPKKFIKLSPAERVNVEEIRSLIKSDLTKELKTRLSFVNIRLEDIKPDYVINSLNEIAKIV